MTKTLRERFLYPDFGLPAKQRQSLQYEFLRIAELVEANVPPGKDRELAVESLVFGLEYACRGIRGGDE